MVVFCLVYCFYFILFRTFWIEKLRRYSKCLKWCFFFPYVDAPLHVIILGSTEAKVGDIVQLNCTAGASNPPATIRWLVDGRQVHNNNSRVVPDPENGWITSSTISFPIKSEKINIVVFCHGVNSLLNENVVATHNINVLC